VREQRVVLEDRVDLALVGRVARDVAAGELDGARVRALEAADEPQRRRLARPRRAEQREELAGADLEVEPLERDDLAVGLAQADRPDGWDVVGRGRPLRLCRHHAGQALPQLFGNPPEVAVALARGLIIDHR
jgi:hypothetical protein